MSIHMVCEAPFTKPILGATKANGQWGDIPWWALEGKMQTVHLSVPPFCVQVDGLSANAVPRSVAGLGVGASRLRRT